MNLENKKQIAIILLAVGLGLVASILTANHVQKSIKEETAALAKEYEERSIQPILQQVDMLTKAVQQLDQRQAQMAQQQVISGQQPVAAQPEMPRSSLAVKTPPGKRALTLLVDSLSAVGGLIGPGDYVDIMAHLSIPPPPNTNLQPDKMSGILFQNIQVLAVGTNIQSPPVYESQQQSSVLTITFAVDPEEAGLLVFAQQNGKLQLALRNTEESEAKVLQPATWENLAQYSLDKNGMEIAVPKSRAMIQPVGPGNVVPANSEEVKPYIQIFREGKEL